MATLSGGVVKGKKYNKRDSFTVASTQYGWSSSDGTGTRARQVTSGGTAWYIQHIDTMKDGKSNVNCPIGICTTNNSWHDGWYPLSIIPAATYTITLSHGGDDTNTGSVKKTWGASVSLPTNVTKASTTANGYTVTYNYGGNGKANESVTVKNTTSYSFKEWRDGSTAVSSTYNPYEPDFGTEAANKTLTAAWDSTTTKGSVTLPTPSWANTSTSGTVTYNASTNGGTTDKTSDNVNLTVTHTFKGWYNNGSYVAMGNTTYTPTANVTLTASWDTKSSGSATVKLPTASKANGTASRTVTINANGGSTTVSSRTSSATVTYTSSGWWTKSTNGDKVGNNGDSITPSTAPITYYAQFTSKTGSYSAVTLPTTAQCTRSGYALKGFATSNSATTASYSPGASYTPSGNVTLYAVWEEIAGKIYIKKDGAWVEAKAVYTKVNGTWI